MCVFLSHPKRLPRMEIRRKYSPSLRLSVHPICVRHKLGLHKLGSDKKYGSDHQRSIMNTLDCNRIWNINQIAKNKGQMLCFSLNYSGVEFKDNMLRIIDFILFIDVIFHMMSSVTVY